MDNIYIYYYINLLMIAGNIAALYDQLQNIYHCLKGNIIQGFGLLTEDMCKCLLGQGYFYKYFWL